MPSVSGQTEAPAPVTNARAGEAQPVDATTLQFYSGLFFSLIE